MIGGEKTMYSIRRANKADTEAVMHLLAQVNRVHHDGRPDLFRLGTKYTPEELERIFADDARPVFVSTDENGEVLGYAFCILQQHVGSHLMTDIKTLYIDDLCVDEHARGRRVGTGLYEYVLAYARAIGCYNVTLNVWSLNHGAMRFYEKCGLVPQKVGMEKILSCASSESHDAKGE